MLTGQAKKDYQREYMRKRRAEGKKQRRSNNLSHNRPELVRPQALDLVRPEQNVRPTEDKIETQSYNPMMVGYVPLVK